MRLLKYFILCFVLISQVHAQDSLKDINFSNVGMTNLSFGYGMEYPFGDLSDRYDRNLKFTVGAERMTSSNWIYGIEFAFMFGDTVKEDVLSSLRLDNGEVLGSDNAYADVFTRQRGMFLGFNFGKIISLNEDSRGGLRLTNAIGIFQHNVRVVDEARSLPQIEGDYTKGYDRMTRGFATRQFVGYHHISGDRRINFIIGVEFTAGFTKHIRAVDFDTGLQPSQDTRFDGLFSLKAAYILPFFDDYEDAEVFY